MSTTESSRWSFGWGKSGNPFDSFKLFGKEDAVEEEDPSTTLRRATLILVIGYSIIDSLIITSNLLTALMIGCTRLRYSLFHIKILICSIGDLIFGVVLAFAVLELKDPRHAWYYGDVFCYITKYVSATHLFFISLSLCALICDRIIKETTRYHKVAVFCIHGFLLTLPFVAAYIVAVPVLVSNDIVTITNLTDTDKKDYSFCRNSQNYESNKIIAVSVFNVMQNTIFLPFCIILSIVLINRRRRLSTNTPENMDNKSAMRNSNGCSACLTYITSSCIAVIIITIVTLFCTVPDCILHFCSDCLNEDTMYSVPHILYMLSLVPSIVRPYLWLIDKEMRQVAARICGFVCRRNRLT